MRASTATASHEGWVLAALIAGLVALAARPVALGAIAVTAIVGAAGAEAPVPRHASARSRWNVWLAATAVGLGAVAIARAGSQLIPSTVAPWQVAAGLGAAVAEELFFRRFLYGWLVRWGVAIAVAGSAIAFAVVHVPAYGVAALPIDLAAGLVFSWQRWVTGTWTAPAATHLAANLSMLL
jgi:membrane protease YdiL (CAAX protease family)